MRATHFLQTSCHVDKNARPCCAAGKHSAAALVAALVASRILAGKFASAAAICAPRDPHHERS